MGCGTNLSRKHIQVVDVQCTVAVEITNDKVYLAGRGDRGTVYAVYDFLENDIGCRWLQPGQDGDFVPRLSEIRLKAGRREETPVFAFRIAGARHGLACSHGADCAGKLIEFLDARGL